MHSGSTVRHGERTDENSHARTFPTEEAPTKPIDEVPSKLLAFAMRIDRLTALAEERLSVGPDPDAVLAALADLAQVRALAGAVLR